MIQITHKNHFLKFHVSTNLVVKKWDMEVCEKSNETDFSFTKVFIFFKQCYPLKSSVLGQLYTGGVVVPTLGSSAGSLQLVWLLTGRSQSFECSPEFQNDVLLRHVSISGKGKSHKDSNQVNRGVEEQQKCVLRSKISIVLLFSCEVFRHHFGANLSHAQIV